MLSDNTVSFVMTADDLITVEAKDPLSRVRELFTEYPIHHIPVLEGNKLVGLISSTDLLRVGIGVHRDDGPADSILGARFSAAQAMETALVTLHPKDSLLTAAKLLAQETFNSLPVVVAKVAAS